MVSLNRISVLLIYSAIMLSGLGVFTAAQDNFTFVRDTSFTLNSAHEKIRDKFPHVIPARTPENNSVKAYYNVPYISFNGRTLSVDIFLSSAADCRNRTGIIIIHGGGWSSGCKEMEHSIAYRLASEGFNVYIPEYRLSPEALYPAGMQDIISAVKWVKSTAKLYRTDTTKIVLMGMSSGAHMATLAAAAYDFPAYQSGYFTEFSARVSAVINIDGVLDLTVPAESGKDTAGAKPSSAKKWIGYTYREKPELWKEASPVNHVTKSTPPVLFINSSIERFHAGRDEMIRKMEVFGIHSEVHTFDNTPHTFWLFDPWAEKACEIITRFLRKF